MNHRTLLPLRAPAMLAALWLCCAPVSGRAAEPQATCSPSTTAQPPPTKKRMGLGRLLKAAHDIGLGEALARREGGAAADTLEKVSAVVANPDAATVVTQATGSSKAGRAATEVEGLIREADKGC